MISDPYSVLGVSRDAAKEEIKKAYRKKAKEYHPDLHPDDPNASQKMNEINEAYDMLNNPEKYEKQRNPYAGYGYGAGQTGTGSYADANSEIRQAMDFIYIRQYGYARAVLNSIPVSQRSGQWYYLSALTHYGLGNLMAAMEHLQIAIQLEPDNPEYRRAAEMMNRTGYSYKEAGQEYHREAEDLNRFCSSMCALHFLFMFCCGC